MIITKDTRYPKIPLDAGAVPDWKTIPIRKDAVFDPLVPLGMLSQEASGLMTSAIYYGEHNNSPYAVGDLKNSLLTIFARRSVARRLLEAERNLPAGHHLVIFDAYRPYEVQKSLYDFFKQGLHEKHPEKDEATLEAETQRYVSLPSTDPTRPAPHNTGGAVDLAIIKLDEAHEKELQQLRRDVAEAHEDNRAELEKQLSALIRRHAEMLWFGTPFDHGGEKSALAYYESKIAAGEQLAESDEIACNNRRLLFKVMTQAGFQPYFAEWWHFNAPETQMGAAAAGLDHASFGAMQLDEDNVAHEQARLAMYGAEDREVAQDWPVEVIAPPQSEE